MNEYTISLAPAARPAGMPAAAAIALWREYAWRLRRMQMLAAKYSNAANEAFDLSGRTLPADDAFAKAAALTPTDALVADLVRAALRSNPTPLSGTGSAWLGANHGDTAVDEGLRIREVLVGGVDWTDPKHPLTKKIDLDDDTRRKIDTMRKTGDAAAPAQSDATTARIEEAYKKAAAHTARTLKIVARAGPAVGAQLTGEITEFVEKYIAPAVDEIARVARILADPAGAPDAPPRFSAALLTTVHLVSTSREAGPAAVFTLDEVLRFDDKLFLPFLATFYGVVLAEVATTGVAAMYSQRQVAAMQAAGATALMAFRRAFYPRYGSVARYRTTLPK